MPKFNKEKFAIGAGLLSEASKSISSGQMKIVGRDLEELVPNKLNKYSMSRIEDLADSIRTIGGLQQPIVYLEPAQNDGTYKIIAGHRRYAAYQLLAKEDPKWGRNIPCTPTTLDSVDLPIPDDLKERYLILTTNAASRDKTDADKMLEYLEQKAIYERAKANGYKLNSRMRELIAKDLNQSVAQIGKYDYVTEHAIDSVISAIKEDKLSISDAHKIAHEPVETQQQIVSSIKSISETNSESDKIMDSKPSDSDIKKEVKELVKKKTAPLKLEQESYEVDIKREFNVLSLKLEEIKTQADAEHVNCILDQKQYAKFLKSQEKIAKELETIAKILARA